MAGWASHVSLFPSARTFAGTGGGLESATIVSLTYSVHALAIDSFGSHAALSGSPVYFAAGTASPPRTGASQALSVGIATSGFPAVFGRRAVRQASSHGMAR